MKQRVFVVANPQAGGGTARLLWPQVAEALRKRIGNFDFEESTAIGHARFIALDAAKAGYDLVVAYGGDGTIHEVVNGLFQSGGASGAPRTPAPRTGKAGFSSPTRHRPVLGILCVGTGGDLVKTLGIPKKLAEQVKILATSKTRALDLGMIEFAGRDGKREKRVFINISSAGLSADVLRRLGRSRSFFGRKFAYLAATLESYIHWKPKAIAIKTDHSKSSEIELPKCPLLVTVANGRFFGGGMPIAPTADPADGYLDLVVVDSMSPWKVPVALSLLYFKQFHRLEGVFRDRVRKVTLTSEEPVGLDIDGEPVGSLPATFEILPGAIEVKVP